MRRTQRTPVLAKDSVSLEWHYLEMVWRWQVRQGVAADVLETLANLSARSELGTSQHIQVYKFFWTGALSPGYECSSYKNSPQHKVSCNEFGQLSRFPP